MEPTLNLLAEGQEVRASFLVANKAMAKTKSGKNYLALTLRDRTGQMPGRVWDGADELNGNFSENQVVMVNGTVVSFLGSLQLNIRELVAIPDERIDFDRFLPCVVPEDLDGYLRWMGECFAGFANVHLRGLLFSFLDDPVFVEKLRKAPAAKSAHHVRLGGLLEHTYNVLRHCEAIVALRRYPKLDRELLLTGAFFHDIGKIDEISVTKGFSFTVEGQLLGHIVLGYRTVIDRIERIGGFPEELAILIGHLILSHQGTLAFGSPKRPQIVEAVLLHYIDDLDAKMNISIEHLLNEKIVPGAFSSYCRLLENPLYLPLGTTERTS